MSTIQELKPWEMPLHGVSLIEASAGTGKTYNITSLYLRLLLERGLAVGEILVVTFTKAATEELRERIRTRVAQAMQFLVAEDRSACRDKDGELAEWLYARDTAADDERVLKAALVSMDEAAVFTIHGFCQRVLQENAFDTGMAFELEFIESEDMLRQQAAEDFWRQWFADATIPAMASAWLLNRWSSPEEVLGIVQNRLSWGGLKILPPAADKETVLKEFVALEAALRDAHQQMKARWDEEQDEVTRILQEHPGLNRQSYNKKAIAICLEMAERICSSDSPVVDLDEKFKLLTPDFMATKTKKNAETPENAFFVSCAEYQQAVTDVEAIFNALGVVFLQEARKFIQHHLQQTKSRARQLYFDDLLIQLQTALKGERGAPLAKQLRSRFPVAMIDEFQDTDDVQYSIFHTIYGQLQNGSDHGLYLIGDPKQAIYSFRGGDIFTYLKAAADAENKYSLGVNWRSSSPLIAAVNTLFEAQDNPFVQEDIAYHPVKPSPGADCERLLIDGKEPASMMFWKLMIDAQGKGKSITVAEARQRAAEHCAHHIAALLDPGRTVLGERPLQAGDIAILVRSHSHAKLIQATLAENGINSVTLSEESVFHSEEAESLLHLLVSISECEDEKLLRYALVDRLLGRTATEIDELLADEDKWETCQQQFLECRRLWREQGFIQAFQYLFTREKIVQRLLNRADGERRLTNLLQLMELLQQASMKYVGMEELLRWFADEMEQAGKGEAARLRLESDEALVKVVTMHASKGLEYPVVYIPFPWTSSGPIKNHYPWFYHDEEKNPSLYLGGGDESLEEEAGWRQRQEQMAEDMRLFYVAITRAAKLCILAWGKVNKAENSALAWLLHPGDSGQSDFGKLSEAEIFKRLDELASTAPAGAIEISEPPPKHRYRNNDKNGNEPELQARDFSTPIERNWRVSSYSSLTRGQDLDRPDYDASPAMDEFTALDDAVQALPAGSQFGVFMHQLFEELDFSQVEPDALREKIQSLALRFGLTEIQDENVEAMVTLIDRTLDTELPQVGLCLRELKRSDRLDEMEFHFSTGVVDARSLQRELAGYSGWAKAAENLNFSAFHGLMHGYIDLVFRHKGRYYLADYKSNRLAQYGQEAMEAAMHEHHYPLQGLVYALALHRYLQQRLAGYDYRQHFGGVCYLFTRGMRPGTADGVWFRRPEQKLIESLDRLFSQRAAA